MKITLYVWDVREAIEEYIAEQLGANTERFNTKEMYFEYEQTRYDSETGQWVTSEPTTYPFDEDCQLTVHIEEVTT